MQQSWTDQFLKDGKEEGIRAEARQNSANG
jgi:hypothetical protein